MYIFFFFNLIGYNPETTSHVMEEDNTGGDGLMDFGEGSQRPTGSSSSFGGDDAPGQFEGMHPSLYRALQMVIARIPGLRLITISNAFGLPVVRGKCWSLFIMQYCMIGASLITVRGLLV